MIYIGTSGWNYNHWGKVFYPEGIRPWQRLRYFTQHFGTAELNSSFYRWPADSSFRYWKKSLPEGFLLSVKAPRALTHVKRLFQPESWIERLQNSWHELGDNRAILLVQLSPNFSVDYCRLGYFLEQLPSWIRVAVEFRHPSWHCDNIYQLLRRHGAAYCVMSGAYLPCHLMLTGTFAYVRMHGPDQRTLYAGSYSSEDLQWWRERIKEWEHQGKDVFVYFNNDGFGNAVNNARQLQSLLINT